jgi:GDP-4-dehydro-6-deoxy-D-mannose reductase
MKILLLGGDSPLGLYLSKYWSIAYPNVEILRTSRRGRYSESELGFEFPKSRVERLIKQVRPDVVFNLISYRGANESLASAINVELPREILRSQLDTHNFHAVLFGSAAEYGLKSYPEVLSEDSPLKPESAYGISKARQSELAGSEINAGATILYLRIFNLFGLGMSPSLLSGRLEKSISQLRFSEKKEIHLDHANDVRDFISKERFAAILGEMVSNQYHGIINIASGIGLEVGKFAKYFVESVLEAKDVEWRTTVSNSPTYSIADVSKLKKEFPCGA